MVTDNERRIAFVTGGSKGIGAATSCALARSGLYVAVGYASDEVGARQVVEDIKSSGGIAIAVHCDVTRVDSVENAFAEIERTLGKVAVLVNNGGITADGLIMRMTDEQWSSVIETNLSGAFRTIRRATPGMLKHRYGRIINVSSASGQMGIAGQANYSAAKAGLVGLTRSFARELGSRGITANIVAPGPIDTAMTDGLTDEWRSQAEAQVALRRFGTPIEVADVIAFLCSPEASYITGAIIPVDGGLAMGH